MNRLHSIGITFVLLCIGVSLLSHTRTPDLQKLAAESERSYLGFDRNIYPGDAALPVLRKTFAFSSYWLSPPPGERTNTWSGKRGLLRKQGFGFVVLFRGRDSSELKKESDAKIKGARDGEDSVAAAKSEGFFAGTVIFLDIEEGGRLPDTYHTYLATWSKVLTRAGYRAGAYCSGIPVKEGPKVIITTADDIRHHAPTSDIAIWAYNDACPPSGMHFYAGSAVSRKKRDSLRRGMAIRSVSAA